MDTTAERRATICFPLHRPNYAGIPVQTHRHSRADTPSFPCRHTVIPAQTHRHSRAGGNPVRSRHTLPRIFPRLIPPKGGITNTRANVSSPQAGALQNENSEKTRFISPPEYRYTPLCAGAAFIADGRQKLDLRYSLSVDTIPPLISPSCRDDPVSTRQDQHDQSHARMLFSCDLAAMAYRCAPTHGLWLTVPDRGFVRGLSRKPRRRIDFPVAAPKPNFQPSTAFRRQSQQLESAHESGGCQRPFDST